VPVVPLPIAPPSEPDGVVTEPDADAPGVVDVDVPAPGVVDVDDPAPGVDADAPGVVDVDVPAPGVVDVDVPALGEAAGFDARICASRLHASKSAWVGVAARATPHALRRLVTATSAMAYFVSFMVPSC
jgi:hypothetical protein